MNKFLILLSSLFALTFFGCNNDEEELDLIDTLENEKIAIHEYLSQITTPILYLEYYSVHGMLIDTVFIFNYDNSGEVAKDTGWVLMDYEKFYLNGAKLDTTSPEQGDSTFTYAFGGPALYRYDTVKKYDYVRWFTNTLFVAAVSCIISTILVIAISYTMSRYRFKSRKQMMKATLILNIFPNFMNMTALFVLMTQFQLINNLWGLILLYSSGATMGFLVQKGFFDTIPGTIYDAATLDGANDLRVFISITIPLAKPMIVYTALTAFVWPWADFMLPSMLLIDKSSWTVAVGLNKLNESEFSIFAAGAIFVAVPIVALYIALSKYLIQGGAAGAVKE